MSNRCPHLEHAMVVGNGPHICQSCEIKALKEENLALKTFIIESGKVGTDLCEAAKALLKCFDLNALTPLEKAKDRTEGLIDL